MKRILGLIALMVSSGAVAMDRLPTDDTSNGYVLCRSYLVINNIQVGHWSELFQTTETSQSVAARWEAYIKSTYPHEQLVPACLKFKTAADGAQWNHDTKFVQTRWKG